MIIKLKKTTIPIVVGRRNDILVIDDVLPSKLSPWRSYEFNEVFKFFPNSKLYSNTASFEKYSLGNGFTKCRKELEEDYPNLSGKIRKLYLFSVFTQRIAYVLFFHNISFYYKIFEKNNIDFVFTLYPGGGFYLDNLEIVKRLELICESKNFRGVIVNQFITKKYLLDKKICSEEKIHLFHGVPINLEYYRSYINENKRFDGSLRILFMANKYTSDGKDKGFPVFQKVARELILKDDSIRFDIIGGFSKSDLVYRDFENYFIFHGLLQENQFFKILNNTHIILSPNFPFVLNRGAFDGFPLGATITGGIFLNAMIMTDYFSESKQTGWIDDKHFLEISLDLDDIIRKIDSLLNDRKKLKELAYQGQKKIFDQYSYKNQILPRVDLFKKVLNG